mgnify:FL=1
MAAVYKTKSGDVWDSIAREVYGDETYTSLLMANNQEHLGYFVFPAGVELVIKDKPEEASTLPDWRS